MIKLSEHFNYEKLLRFTAPSMGTMVVMSIYGVVDGFFVSNFVGTIQFASLSFLLPPYMLLIFIGTLFGTGGSALIGKTLGEGKRNKANEIFSMLVYLSIVIGVVLGILGIIYVRDVAAFLGATDEILEYGVGYAHILLLALPFVILQMQFDSYFSTAEKPQLGFYVTIAAGLTNVALDALFIVGFGFGLQGAAAATAISEFIGGALPLIYFGRKNSSLLRLTKTYLDLPALFKTCTNGVSELLSSVSMSIVGMLYNWQLLKYAGTDGVAAFAVMMYATMIFESAFIGYSMGAAPVVAYNYGAKNYSELKSLLRKSLTLIGIFAVIMFTCAQIFAGTLIDIFLESNEHIFEMAVHGFKIFSFSYLLMGFGLFTSAFFTALNNGKLSAIISGMRTLVFEVAAVLILPLIFGLDGIWLSMVGAEIMAVTVAVILLKANAKRYRYF